MTDKKEEMIVKHITEEQRESPHREITIAGINRSVHLASNQKRDSVKTLANIGLFIFEQIKCIDSDYFEVDGYKRENHPCKRGKKDE